MGWLFSQRWPLRSDLIKHLTEENGMVTIKKFLSGNHLWCVHELPDGRKFIALYLISKGPAFHGGPNWGYKDIDETMGPAHFTCPASFLDIAQPEPTEGYAVSWRAEVRRRDALMKSFKKGMKVRWVEGSNIDSSIDEFELLQRRSPTCFIARGDNGFIYRLGKHILSFMEVSK